LKTLSSLAVELRMQNLTLNDWLHYVGLIEKETSLLCDENA
jgi:hypothetical protein